MNEELMLNARNEYLALPQEEQNKYLAQLADAYGQDFVDAFTSFMETGNFPKFASQVTTTPEFPAGELKEIPGRANGYERTMEEVAASLNTEHAPVYEAIVSMGNELNAAPPIKQQEMMDQLASARGQEFSEAIYYTFTHPDFCEYIAKEAQSFFDTLAGNFSQSKDQVGSLLKIGNFSETLSKGVLSYATKGKPGNFSILESVALLTNIARRNFSENGELAEAIMELGEGDVSPEGAETLAENIEQYADGDTADVPAQIEEIAAQADDVPPTQQAEQKDMGCKDMSQRDFARGKGRSRAGRNAALVGAGLLGAGAGTTAAYAFNPGARGFINGVGSSIKGLAKKYNPFGRATVAVNPSDIDYAGTIGRKIVDHGDTTIGRVDLANDYAGTIGRPAPVPNVSDYDYAGTIGRTAPKAAPAPVVNPSDIDYAGTIGRTPAQKIIDHGETTIGKNYNLIDHGDTTIGKIVDHGDTTIGAPAPAPTSAPDAVANPGLLAQAQGFVQKYPWQTGLAAAGAAVGIGAGIYGLKKLHDKRKTQQALKAAQGPDRKPAFFSESEDNIATAGGPAPADTTGVGVGAVDDQTVMREKEQNNAMLDAVIERYKSLQTEEAKAEMLNDMQQLLSPELVQYIIARAEGEDFSETENGEVPPEAPAPEGVAPMQQPAAEAESGDLDKYEELSKQLLGQYEENPIGKVVAAEAPVAVATLPEGAPVAATEGGTTMAEDYEREPVIDKYEEMGLI